MLKHTSFLCLLILGLCSRAELSAQTASNSRAQLSAQTTDSSQTRIDQLKKDIPDLMQKADIPGLSIALIHDGQLVWTGSFGYANTETKKPVTDETLFEAASLSKPVFAYGVLKLVDKGQLDLDTPLNKYLGNNYDVAPGDNRINLITARRVLSHTSGFPNWRPQDSKTLPINFTPGEKFSYSGEGMVYLSKVIEKITGLSLEDYMQREVLQPLGMRSSSYIWQDRFDTLKSYKHDEFGHPSGRWQPKEGNAAASLATNATDYARFLIAMLNGNGLKTTTWRQMFTPQIRVNEKYPQVAWGLGWGLETMDNGVWFWHWGDNGDTKAYITAQLDTKNAVVYFANGANGLSITQEVLADAIGGEHPALAHLSYQRYNSPARTLLKSILTEGAAPALARYQQQRQLDTTQKISENDINSMGYSLLRLKHIDDAIIVFKTNTQDFPGSWNVWDSLAEGYANKGDKKTAIKYYEQSLSLNPDNKNGAEQLKKLRTP